MWLVVAEIIYIISGCSKVSGVTEVAMVVYLMRASGVMGVGVFVC